MKTDLLTCSGQFSGRHPVVLYHRCWWTYRHSMQHNYSFIWIQLQYGPVYGL